MHRGADAGAHERVDLSVGLNRRIGDDLATNEPGRGL